MHHDVSSLSRLLGLVPKDKTQLRVIAIQDKTLTVTNGLMAIRRFCDAQDGYYQVSENGLLRPCLWRHGYVDTAELEKKYLSPPVSRGKLTPEQRFKALEVAHMARDVGKELHWDQDGFWHEWPAKDHPRQGQACPTGLPFRVTLDPDYMIISLTELARYGEIDVIKSDNASEPLVLGLNWGSCCMVMPIRKYGNEELDG